jgi:hypothetical protein
MSNEADGCIVEKCWNTAMVCESHYKAALAENERLRALLKAALEKAELPEPVDEA